MFIFLSKRANCAFQWPTSTYQGVPEVAMVMLSYAVKDLTRILLGFLENAKIGEIQYLCSGDECWYLCIQ